MLSAQILSDSTQYTALTIFRTNVNDHKNKIGSVIELKLLPFYCVDIITLMSRIKPLSLGGMTHAMV